MSAQVIFDSCSQRSYITSNMCEKCRPVALETKLGWVLSGPAAIPASTESCTVNLSSTHVLEIESADISHVQDDLQHFGT